MNGSIAHIARVEGRIASGLVGSTFLNGVARLATRRWIRRIHGRFPSHGPAVIIANHASYLDAVILAASIKHFTQTPIRFWTNRIIANHPLFKHAFHLSRSLEVSPQCLLGTWRESLRVLEGGGFIGIFPEGTRSRTGGIAPFKQGYLRLANAAQVPIVPVYISNAFEILPPHRRVPSKVKTDVFFEDAIWLPARLPKQDLKPWNEKIVTSFLLAHNFAYGESPAFAGGPALDRT